MLTPASLSEYIYPDTPLVSLIALLVCIFVSILILFFLSSSFEKLKMSSISSLVVADSFNLPYYSPSLRLSLTLYVYLPLPLSSSLSLCLYVYLFTSFSLSLRHSNFHSLSLCLSIYLLLFLSLSLPLSLCLCHSHSHPLS